MVEINVPTIGMKRGKRIPVINYWNKEGWLKYPEVSDKYATKIIETINSTDDADKLEVRIKIIEEQIALECFGITWQGTGKKSKKKNQQQLQEMYDKEQFELDDLLNLKDSNVFKEKAVHFGDSFKIS